MDLIDDSRRRRAAHKKRQTQQKQRKQQQKKRSSHQGSSWGRPVSPLTAWGREQLGTVVSYKSRTTGEWVNATVDQFNPQFGPERVPMFQITYTATPDGKPRFKSLTPDELKDARQRYQDSHLRRDGGEESHQSHVGRSSVSPRSPSAEPPMRAARYHSAASPTLALATPSTDTRGKSGLAHPPTKRELGLQPRGTGQPRSTQTLTKRVVDAPNSAAPIHQGSQWGG